MVGSSSVARPSVELLRERKKKKKKKILVQSALKVFPFESVVLVSKREKKDVIVFRVSYIVFRVSFS